MRLLTYILIAVILLCAACNPTDKRIIATLDHAESIMEEHPDSALAMLDTLRSESLRTEEDRARYALLYTQARDKNYIDDTSDSLIAKAVAFYKDSNDKRRAMLSHYYIGRIYENAQNYPDALYHQMRGYKLAQEIKDTLWIARTCRSIADMFMATYKNEAAVKYARLTYEAMKATGNPRYIRESLLDLSRAYNNNLQYDSALMNYPRLIDEGIAIKDTVFTRNVRSLYGITLYATNRFKEAAVQFSIIDDPNDSIRPWVGYLTRSYVESGEIEKASKLIDACKRMNDIQACIGLSSYYEYVGRYKEAFEAFVEEHRQSNIMLEWQMKQNLTEPYTQIINEEDMAHKSQTAYERAWWIAAIILIVSIATITGMYIIWRYRRKQQALRASLESLGGVAREYDEICGKIATLNKSVLQNEYKLANEFYNELYTMGDNDQTRKRFLTELTKRFNDITHDSTKQAEMEAWVNQQTDNLIERFRTLLPNLKDEDYRLFLYSVLGFSNNAMALLINAPDLTSVYNRRKRLRIKLRSITGIDVKEFIEYLN